MTVHARDAPIFLPRSSKVAPPIRAPVPAAKPHKPAVPAPRWTLAPFYLSAFAPKNDDDDDKFLDQGTNLSIYAGTALWKLTCSWKVVCVV